MKKYLVVIFITISCTINAIDIVKDSWIIEWAELNGENLSLSNQLLLSSIPTYFMENIDKDHNHYVDSQEKSSVFEHLKEIKKKELFLSRSELLSKESDFFFNNTTSSKIEESKKKIQEINDDIDSLKKILYTDDIIPNSFKINFLPENGKNFNSYKDYNIKNYILREGIDYYISGTIEEDSDNLFVTIILYSIYEDEPKVIWSGVGDSEEILNYRAEMLQNIHREIISENLLTYSINTTPPDALVYVNDAFKGLGSFNGYTINKENIDIEVLKEGFYSISLNTLIARDNFEIPIKLVPINSQNVTVNSNPPGALAYYGSKYIGTTPLEVPLYSYAQKLTLSYIGYMDRSIVIDKNSKDISLNLTKGLLDREENFIKEKENFYMATGVFSISLGVPLYLNAVDGNIDEIITNIAIGNAVFWGLNLFYRLYCYLNAAEISVE